MPFRDFVIHFFAIGTSQITAYVQALNEAVTLRLVRELGYRLEAMDAELPDDRRAEVPPATIQIIGTAQNVIQQNATGSNINQSANIQNNPELEDLFGRLIQAVRDAETDPARLEEHLEVIATAQEEAQKQEPRRSVVRTLLCALPAAGAVSEITSLILDLITG